ncbi:Txe/YoeB family addiction module toxin [Membranicola marinus]|uniref:Putative mRNA interferase YoeB n=1 Tax=Membranihabitans marinus TaxID=1227546 RepID=A0A953L7F1_9BACT|nr:Txe/YoeB family addiction module toxin [Membranihabitans marinus]MBY5958662.1 Txe/YoeB family addiction module toxin [Membranihabitans marinus]
MRSIAFHNRSFQEYEKLRQKNKKLHIKLLKILVEMQRSNPWEGTGKPEMLKGEYSGLWLRRLNAKDRLIYRFDEKTIYIFAIGGHFDDH